VKEAAGCLERNISGERSRKRLRNDWGNKRLLQREARVNSWGGKEWRGSVKSIETGEGFEERHFEYGN